MRFGGIPADPDIPVDVVASVELATTTTTRTSLRVSAAVVCSRREAVDSVLGNLGDYLRTDAGSAG